VAYVNVSPYARNSCGLTPWCTESIVDDADDGIQRVGDEVDHEPDDDQRHQEGDGDGRAGDEGVPEATGEPTAERGTVLGQEWHT
jgi:hypothetical protein